MQRVQLATLFLAFLVFTETGHATNFDGKSEVKLGSCAAALGAAIAPPTRIIENHSQFPKGSDFETFGIEDPTYQAVLASARRMGDDRAAFWNMLATYVGPTGYRIPEGDSTVLMVGCGKAEEAIVLSAFFGNSGFGTPSEKVKIIGIDLDGKEIDAAVERNKTIDFSKSGYDRYLPSNYQFIVGNATRLDDHPSIPRKVDVVVSRHQQISDSDQVWGEIFSQGLQRLRPGGVFIFTSYSEIEADMLVTKLKSLGANIVHHGKNRYARPLGHDLISKDRVVTIVRKPE